MKLISVRLDDSLVKDIEKYSKLLGVDKSHFIQKGTEMFLGEMAKGYKDEALQDYLNLRITDEDLCDALDIEKVPFDIRKAREEVLKSKIKEK